MQTIRVLCVALTAGVVSSLAIAQQKPPSINFYIHDVDTARMVVKRDRAVYEAELGKLASKPQEMVKFINTESPVVNASHALSRLYTSFEVKQPLSKCFGGKKLADITTASTDHACVDAAGFKR